MFVGLLALILGFFSGPFSLFHNPKISAGVALMLSSLSWREWERSTWHDSSPPYKTHLEFKPIFWAIIFAAFAVWMFKICYLASG